MVEVLLKLDKSATLNKINYTGQSITFNKLFNLYDIVFLNNNYVLIEVKETNLTIKSIISKIDIIEGNKILYFHKLTNNQRIYLIENKISFFEGSRYYFIANNINVEFQKEVHNSEHFKAITQLVYIYILESNTLEITIDNITNNLKISKISASRSLNELYNYKLLNYKFIGVNARKKVYYYNSKDEFYFEGYKYIKNPISKIIYIKKNFFDYNYIYSSSTALANISLYEGDSFETVAVYKRGFKCDDFLYSVDGLNSNDYYCVELWSYDPCSLGAKNADIISLQKIYEDKNDYRANIEIQRIIAEKKWNTD